MRLQHIRLHHNECVHLLYTAPSDECEQCGHIVGEWKKASVLAALIYSRQLSEVTIASIFFVETSLWNTAVCTHRSPFDFSVGMLACPPHCPAIWCQPGIGLISVYFSYLNLSPFFFYLFLGCLLVVLGSCAILSKSSLFHAANKNEQDPNQHIYRWHNSEKWHAKIPKRKVWEKQR